MPTPAMKPFNPSVTDMPMPFGSGDAPDTFVDAACSYLRDIWNAIFDTSPDTKTRLSRAKMLLDYRDRVLNKEPAPTSTPMGTGGDTDAPADVQTEEGRRQLISRLKGATPLVESGRRGAEGQQLTEADRGNLIRRLRGLKPLPPAAASGPSGTSLTEAGRPQR